MILRIEGNANPYYVQTLCMIFFPGSTFSDNELPGLDVPEVTVNVFKEDDGSDTAFVSMKLNDKVCEATETVSPDEQICITEHAAIAIGRAVFAAGKELLGHIPPWGILTGVRPAKIAGALLADGNGILKTKKILRDEYFLGHQKAALAVSVATNEAKLLKKMEKNTCSIYISIPFCPSRCAYCSFVSYTTPRLLSMVDDYLDALVDEIDEKFEAIRALGLKVNTVYIGGGTPTTLNPDQLRRLFLALNKHIDTHSLLEFTLEAGRPDTITREKLAVAKEFGVTRVSVNPQTLNDDILREIGRHHTKDDFYVAYDIARESGIRDINVDLIAGLPGDDFRNFSETLDRIIELAPTNITVHTFCVKKASDLLRKNSGVYSISGGDAAKSVAYSQLNTKFAGYKPYYMYRQKNTVGNLENVGFAIEGHEGLYNVFMMEEVQTIFAVGAGAVSKLVDYRGQQNASKALIKRISNPKYPYEYLRLAEKKKQGTEAKKASFMYEVLSFFGKKDN